ncbi:hypothetical protein FHR32_004925 [Streptosporangium album]|uniref:Uncharacterized protein n=1 Tax=Streptosporangium album TaxID=47479 RepID=A0A7W7RYE5_9ACTN|nr:hypothetical protein [Streptosporangium album]MBB4940548.1 hypothetical protein [Streptosporangium album]
MTSGADRRRKADARRQNDGTLPDRRGPRAAARSLDASDALRFEALGRVMAALAAEAELMESCRDLTWWQGTGHGWNVEWREGPGAAEVATALAGHIRDPGVPGSPVTPAGPATSATATFDVLGILFVLRAVDPVGRERIRSRPDFWRLAEAFDTTRRVPSRQPWEELLGG